MKKHFITLFLILSMILELSVTFTLTAGAATEGVYLYNVVDGE